MVEFLADYGLIVATAILAASACSLSIIPMLAGWRIED